MTKIEMLNRIKAHFDEMTPAFGWAKVRDKMNFPEDFMKSQYGTIKKALSWIKKLYNNEFQQVVEIRSLQSEEVWEGYNSWELGEDYPEVKLLRDALTDFRKAILNPKRPSFFRKKNGKTKDKARKARSQDSKTNS